MILQLIYLASAYGHLVSVLDLTLPPLLTPSIEYYWSIAEPLNSLTAIGAQKIHKEIVDLKELYSELLSRDQSKSVIYSKNLPGQIEASQIFAGNFGTDAETLIKNASEDFFLSPEAACPRIHWLMERDRMGSKAFQEVFTKLQPKWHVFEETFGKNLSFLQFSEIGEVFLSYKSRGIKGKLEVLDEIVEDSILAHHKYNELLLYGSKEQGKLATHGFLSEIIEKASSSNVSEFNIYLADHALFKAICKMLGFEGHSESLVIEIHLESYKYLKFRTFDKVLKMPECEEQCPVESFKKIVQKRMFRSSKAHRYACETVGDFQTAWKEYLIYGGVIFTIFAVFMCNTKTAVWVAKKFRKTKLE